MLQGKVATATLVSWRTLSFYR